MKIHELLKKTENFKEVYIFGYYKIGVEVYEELSFYLKEKRILFCDNDIEKQNNVQVFSVSKAVQCSENALFIIVSLYHAQAMKGQLLNEGVALNNIEEYMPISYSLRKDMEEMLYRITPWSELKFEISLAQHCNLNCKYCDHFSPLAAPEIPEFDKFESDICRLAELFCHEAKHISLLGGEPLLNDNITKYIICVRKYFGGAKIDVVTNGILLPKMNKEFWRACREFEIEIRITKYPIKFDYEDMERKCREENVKWSYYGDSKICKYSHHFPLDVNGRQDARYSFLHCIHANKCITLCDGKLYTCSLVPNIKHFNYFFEQGLELSDRDGIDIYKCAKAEDILNFLSNPIPFCRYCDINRRTYENEWGISKKDIKEWT